MTDTTTGERLGNILRDWMKEQGWSYDRLADHLPCGRTYVRDICTKGVIPGDNIIVAIAELIGREPASLLLLAHRESSELVARYCNDHALRRIVSTPIPNGVPGKAMLRIQDAFHRLGGDTELEEELALDVEKLVDGYIIRRKMQPLKEE